MLSILQSARILANHNRSAHAAHIRMRLLAYSAFQRDKEGMQF
jgi:hypothetical protein